MHKRIPHPSVTAITEGAAGRLRGKLAEYRTAEPSDLDTSIRALDAHYRGPTH